MDSIDLRGKSGGREGGAGGSSFKITLPSHWQILTGWVMLAAIFIIFLVVMKNSWGPPWYLFLVLSSMASGALFLFADKQNQKRMSGVVLSAILLSINAVGYICSDEIVKSTTATAPISAPATAGKTFTVTVVAGEKPYVIDRITAGQLIRYLSADGEFKTRIDQGDGRACWGSKNPNSSFTADWGGVLEATTDSKTPVTFKVNIL